MTTAVLVVHLEHDIVHADGAFGPIFGSQVSERDVLARTERFLVAARKQGSHVVFLRIAFQSGHHDLVANGPLLSMVEESRALVDGSPGAAIVDEITVLDQDRIVTHVRPGPFHGSGLHQLLQDAGVSEVWVCGVATNASVEATFRGAADHGYRVGLVEDLCAAADLSAHEASVASMGLFGTIASSDEALGTIGT